MYGNFVLGSRLSSRAFLFNYILKARCSLLDIGILFVFLKELFAGGLGCFLGFSLQVVQIVLNEFLGFLDTYGRFRTVKHRPDSILEVYDIELFHAHAQELASHGESPCIT